MSHFKMTKYPTEGMVGSRGQASNLKFGTRTERVMSISQTSQKSWCIQALFFNFGTLPKSGMGIDRDFKFGTLIDVIMFHFMDDKVP